MEPLVQPITDIDAFRIHVVPAEQKAAFFDIVQHGTREQMLKEIYKYTGSVPVNVDDVLSSWGKFYPQQNNQTLPKVQEESHSGDKFLEGGAGVLESATEIALHHKVPPEETIAFQERERQQVALLKEFHEVNGDETKLQALLEKMGVFTDNPSTLINDRTIDLDARLLSLDRDAQFKLSDAQKSKLEERRKKFAEDKLKQKPLTEDEKKRRDSLVKELLDPKTITKEVLFRQLLNAQLDRTISVESLLHEEQLQRTLLGRIPGLENLPFLKKYTEKTVKKSILTKKQLKAITRKQENDNKKNLRSFSEFIKQQEKAFRKQQVNYLPPEVKDPSIETFDEDSNVFPNVQLPNPIDTFSNFRTGMKVLKTIRGLSGAGGTAEGAGAAIATAPEWGTVLGILALILLGFFIVLIVFIWLQNQTANPYTAPISFATCGDASLGANDANLFAQEFNKRYQKNKFYGIILTAGGGDNATLLQGETEFYSDLCVLFGHLQGFTYKPDVYNTFGTLVMGTNKQIQDMQTVGIHITITAADTTDPCYFKLNSITNGTPSWTFFYNSSCSTGRARFIIAQNLAHNLVLQQQHLEKVHAPLISSADVFNNFSSAYGSTIMTKDTILPTNDCLNNINYGEGEKDQQNRDCFADMVGTFATYPIYYDSPTTSQMGGDSASESATFTSLLSTFPTGGYAEYYTFAKDYLFDGVDFYTSSNSSVLAWADTIDKRLTKAGGTNFDQFTPSANQDTTTCELKVDPIVGNFKDTENPGPACTSLYRAYKANDLLYTVRRRGVPGNTSPMNKLRYWCTDFVIDVFNLASGQRILGENVGMVVYMQQFFAQQSTNPKSGLGFLNYDKDHHVLSQVKPGAAIFFIQTNDGQPHEAEHTGIVTSISIDNNGNGSIHTDEANNMGAKPQYVYPVSNWDIENAPFPVRGFGFLE